MTTGPIIHGGVVMHGIKLAENSMITTLVTSQAIIPIVPIVPQNPPTTEDKKS